MSSVNQSFSLMSVSGSGGDVSLQYFSGDITELFKHVLSAPASLF